jgi:branched-chain amino acid transport system ATP-binding protein
MNTTALLEVDGLTVRFGGLTALEDVSFSVEEHSLFSVIGPNGAGKTTLFNCISGLYRPTAGSIRFAGEDLTGLKPYQVAARGIARTFQNIELFANVTTIENLMLGRHLHMRTGVWRGLTTCFRRSEAAREECEHRERVEHIIDLLELEAARDLPVSGLPYGVQKKIELGRALALDPTLLLLDEPSAGMTAEERQDLMYWIGDIRADLNVSILMIEHHMQMVMDISDRILAVNFGKPICEGLPPQVASHPEVIEAYLGGEEPVGPAVHQ